MLTIMRALACFCLTLQLLSSGVAQDTQLSAQQETLSLKIQSGDLLEISTFDVPELTNSLRVDGNGDIKLPLVGFLHAAGMTPATLADAIDEQLKQHQLVRDPHSSVFVREYATQGVSVLGEVGKPGVYQLLGPRRLLDVLAEAGGFTGSAACEVKIQHRATGEIETATVSSVNSATALENNPYLRPGDTVVVSKAPVVYVIGDVPKPGGFAMQNDGRITLLEALALAGGPKPTAASRHAKLIRRKANGELTETPVEIDQLLAGNTPDTSLQANDVLYVPNSLAKNAAKRTLESIFQVATGLAIYSYRGF